MKTAIIKTKAGYLVASWTAKGLYSLSMPLPDRASAGRELLDVNFNNEPGTLEDNHFLKDLDSQLRAFFEGHKVEFDIEVDFSGYTPFTENILRLVADIPYGKVHSYQDVAVMAGNENGARAVGRALGANRTPLVIPCHRIIRSDGSLGGFSSGLGWKQYLLQLEGIVF